MPILRQLSPSQLAKKPRRPFFSAALIAGIGLFGLPGLARRSINLLPLRLAAMGMRGVQARALPAGTSDPRSLAAGEFHNDGTVDLVAGFADGSAGHVILYRANPAAQTPRTRPGQFSGPAHTRGAPLFLSTGEAFAVPEPPDFLGVGDFNRDGKLDLLAAARGSSAVYLLPGDGRGGFGAPQRLALPGRVTALVVGEINRADGFADFVVGVNGPQGPKAMVFESPLGAWNAQPEGFSLPGEAAALALGRFHGNYTIDLAAAVGSQVVFIEGRDRKLLWDAAHQAAVPPARISHADFPLPVLSLAAGDFENNGTERVAVLLADGSVQRAGPASQAAGAARPAASWEATALPAPPGNRATKLVAGRVSVHGGDDVILLDPWSRQVHVQPAAVPAGRVSHSMTNEPVAALAVKTRDRALSRLVVLEAGQTVPTQITPAAGLTFLVTNTNDSGMGSLRQAILDANNNTAGNNTITFDISGTGPFTISPTSALPSLFSPGTTIDGTSQPGFTGAPLIVLDGTSAGFSSGIQMSSANDVVKGLIIDNFQENGIIDFFSGMGGVITLDLIGLQADGLTPAPNFTGINVFGSSVTISDSVISASKQDGIDLNNGVTGDVIQGSFIGLNIHDQGAGNGLNGIGLFGASNSTIGGTSPSNGNVISGNPLNGISVGLSPSNNPSQGNLLGGNVIGTDGTGRTDIPNNTGILILNSPNNTVGPMNEVAGNTTTGVLITGPNATGDNLFLDIIGDPIQPMPYTPPPGSVGLLIDNGASNNLIGGATPGTQNEIVTNGGNGITLGSTTSGNTIEGNFIGTDTSQTLILGNLGAGIGTLTATKNTIGPNNVVANNQGGGIFIDGGSDQITITHTTIYNNSGFQIQLQNFAANTCGGGGLPGGNSSQNAPIISSAVANSLGTGVQGTLSSTPSGTFTIELFYGSSAAEAGKNFLGSVTVTTGTNCTGTFLFTSTTVVPPGSFITGTATDALGNTSMLSVPVQATGTSSGPVISGFSPMSGPVGTLVTIQGSGFTGATGVSFNGFSAAFMVVNDMTITATVPTGATTGDIIVVTPAGSATSSGVFTVIPPCPTITLTIPALAPLTVGHPIMAGQLTVFASGGTPPYTFQEFGLPSNLFLSTGSSSSTKFIVGTPTSGGTFPTSFSVTDSNGCPGSASFTFVVNPAPTQTTLSAFPTPLVVGQLVNLLATVAEVSGTLVPTGTVEFEVNGIGISLPVTLDNGEAIAPFTPAAAGTITITASYSDAADDLPSSAMMTFVVQQATADLSITSTSQSFVPPGIPFFVQFNVLNSGPNNAITPLLNIVLPDAVMFNTSSGVPCPLPNSFSTIKCPTFSFPAGGTALEGLNLTTTPAAGGNNFVQQFLGPLPGAGSGIDFHAPRQFGPGATGFVAAGDINGDGLADTIVQRLDTSSGSPKSTIDVFFQQTDGTYSQGSPITLSGAVVAGDAGDLNGDGFSDLGVILVEPGTSPSSPLQFSAQVLYGGPLGFTVGPNIPLASNLPPNAILGSYSIRIGPSNFVFPGPRTGSGEDIWIGSGSPTGGDVLDIQNDGSGNFSIGSTLLSPFTGSVSLAVGDVNGDGRPDIIVGPGPGSGSAPSNGNVLTFLAGPPNTGYLPALQTPVGPNGTDIAIGDVNGDSHPDLIVTNDSGAPGVPGSATVFLGDGSGAFLPSATLMAGVEPNGVVIADVNGDGRPDIIVANRGSGTISTFINQTPPGSMSLSFQFQTLQGGQAGPVAITPIHIAATNSDAILATGFTGGTSVAAGITDPMSSDPTLPDNSATIFLSTPLSPPQIQFTLPPSGNPGATVFIFGQNFTGTTVTFNGMPAPIVASNGDMIQTIVPPGATSGPITITTAGGSASSPVPFIVPSSMVNTTTIVTGGPNPSVFGQGVSFTAMVTPASGATIPTGTVQFTIDGAPFGGPVPLVGPLASIGPISSLSVGPHTILAAYSGDLSFNPSASLPFAQTVNQALTTVALTSSPNPSVAGQPVNFTVTLAVIPPGAGTLTGTISLFDGPAFVAAMPVGGNFTVSTLSVGSHNMTAVYSGDPNFTGSTSPVVVQVVQPTTGVPVLSGAVTGQMTGRLELPFVDITFTNTGTGAASAVTLYRVRFKTVSGSGGVSLNTQRSPRLPAQLGPLAPGASVTLRFYLNIGPKVREFSMIEGFSVQSASGKIRDAITSELVTK